MSILEDHTNDTPQTIRTTLCVINTATKLVSELQGIPEADFFAAPVFNGDGTKLAYLIITHPDMPWEGAELYVADVVGSESDGVVGFHITNAKHIAGKKLEVSAAYPSWANNTTLVFTSDESGYQNPWTFSTTTQKAQSVFSIPECEDYSEPAWTLGRSSYATVDAAGNMAVFAAFCNGRNVLYLVDLRGGKPYLLSPCPFVTIIKVRPGKNEFFFAGSKIDGPGGVVRCTLSTLEAPSTPTYKILKSTASTSAKFPGGIISLPNPSTLPIPYEDNLLPIVLYMPTNPAYAGSSIEGEKPPCVVNVHGGKYPNFFIYKPGNNHRYVYLRPDSHDITRFELDHTVLHQSWMGLVSNVAQSTVIPS